MRPESVLVTVAENGNYIYIDAYLWGWVDAENVVDTHHKRIFQELISKFGRLINFAVAMANSDWIKSIKRFAVSLWNL